MSIIVRLVEMTGNRIVGQVAGRHNMGYRHSELLHRESGLREVDLKEAPVTVAEHHERINRLDHARPACPTATDPGGEADDGNLALFER